MPAPPTISVITIFLNAEDYLDEAIDSVVRQSFTDTELILVDDGSTDGSSEIAHQWSREFPKRIRYVEHAGHRNLGMSASRNTGLKEARGDFVTFLDADDVWLHNPLEAQLQILDSNPDVAMTFGPTRWWHSWTGRPEDAGKDSIADPGLPAGVIDPPSLLLLTLQNEGHNPAGILWRKSFLEELGGYESIFRGMYEDQALYAKAFVRARAYRLKDSWYSYRKRDDGCCSVSVRTGSYHVARRNYLRWLAAYLNRENIAHQELWRVLRQELFPYEHPVFFRVQNRLRHLYRKYADRPTGKALFASLSRKSQSARTRARL